jgi:hypothetical protein
MHTKTSEVIERLKARLDALEVTLRGEIRDSLVESKRHAATLDEGVRAEIRASFAEAKRHAAMLNEDVRDDIRMLTESFAAISVKLDSLQR